MSRSSFSFVLSIAFLLICTCSPDEPYSPSIQNESNGTIVFKVTWPSNGYMAKSAGVEAVSSITVYVYSESGTEITNKELEHIGDRGTAEISVPEGNNYQVVLVAFDNLKIQYIGSGDDVDVSTGVTTTAEVTMVNAIPTLYSAESTGNDAYSLSWDSAMFATSYIFEEDDNDTFTSPVSQQTSNLSFPYSNKSTGNYYYRVCSVTPYGNSLWSDIKLVGIGSNGTITIDIPWPDDEYVELSLSDPIAMIINKVNGEIINTGTKDATDVSMTLIGRNSSGVYLGELTYNIGTVEAQKREGFRAEFDNSISYHLIEIIDFTISCNESGPITGSRNVN